MAVKPCDVRGWQCVGSKRGALTEAGKRGSRRKGDQTGDQSNRRRRLTHERPERCRLVESGMDWGFGTGVADKKLTGGWDGVCLLGHSLVLVSHGNLTKTRSKSVQHVIS